MSHPLRVRIFDILSQYGPQTASSLAEHLGESSGATSYHLRQLAKHELIREVAGRGNARERWWERVPGGVTLGPDELGDPSPAAEESSMAILAEYNVLRQQEITRYFTRDIVTTDRDWRLASVYSTTNLTLTSEQLREFNERYHALVDEFVERFRDTHTEGERPVMMHLTSFPLPELGS
jgi:DNA-binding transcriptional ArsR family regulator